MRPSNAGRPDVHINPAFDTWVREPLFALIDHIVGTYHDELREVLPRIERLSAAAVDGAPAYGALTGAIAHVATELSSDLQAHMMKEELVLFPAIRALDAGER